MKKWILFFLLSGTVYGDAELEKLEAPLYQFKGTHYLASFYGCDHEALIERAPLFVAFLRSIKRSGAKILKYFHQGFGEEGLTAIALLAESHASIHTYPEYDNVFIDLFTCGDRCDWRIFEHNLAAYLKPKKIRRKVRRRK